MSKTMRRDKLKRLAAAGRLVMIDSYHFDDMLGESRHEGKEIPVRLRKGPGDFEQGVCLLSDHDFTSGVGHASVTNTPRGEIVNLYVHSNSNMTFRVLPEAEAAQWVTAVQTERKLDKTAFPVASPEAVRAHLEQVSGLYDDEIDKLIDALVEYRKKGGKS